VHEEVGFQVNGIEPSETGCSWARETHGIEVFQGMLEDYLTASNRSTFEVVSLLNVLEHLRDPKEMLMQLRKLIKPNGILAVVVPDARFHDFTVGYAVQWELRIHIGLSRATAFYPDSSCRIICLRFNRARYLFCLSNVVLKSYAYRMLPSF